MLKNKKILVALFFIIIAVLLITVCFLLYKAFDEKKKQDHMLEDTLDTVAVINQESDFLGLSLLDSPPEDFNASLGGEIYSDGGDRNLLLYYYCGIFNESYCINQIRLESGTGNLLGISVGDKAEDAQKVFETYDFIKEGEAEYTYKRSFICIRLTVSEGGIINYIDISVRNPAEDALQPVA